jgi:hypothetical protein
MPSYPLTFPTNVFPENVRVVRRKVTAVQEAPFSLKQQIHKHPGARWEISVTLQPMPASDAAQWTQFFDDCDGRAGTFSFNLTPHAPGLNPGVKVFRMADAELGWDSRLATEFAFTFRAVEDL